MAEDINRIITDFVNYDIENDYYQEDDKDELVRDFKKILYHDDPTVRQWLKAVFNSSQMLADEYDLIAKEGEAEEVPVEEPEGEVVEPEIEEPEGEVEEPEGALEEPEGAVEEPPMEEPEDAEEEAEDAEEKNESAIREVYIKTAANLLYE